MLIKELIEINKKLKELNQDFQTRVNIARQKILKKHGKDSFSLQVKIYTDASENTYIILMKDHDSNKSTYKVKIECSNCGYIEDRTTNEQNIVNLETSIQEESCPKCNSNTFNMTDKISMIEELGSIANTMGTEIDIISSETEEGEMLHSTFGGIVAILRFKLNY